MQAGRERRCSSGAERLVESQAGPAVVGASAGVGVRARCIAGHARPSVGSARRVPCWGERSCQEPEPHRVERSLVDPTWLRGARYRRAKRQRRVEGAAADRKHCKAAACWRMWMLEHCHDVPLRIPDELGRMRRPSGCMSWRRIAAVAEGMSVAANRRPRVLRDAEPEKEWEPIALSGDAFAAAEAGVGSCKRHSVQGAPG